MKNILPLSIVSVAALLTGCGSDSSNTPDAPDINGKYSAIILQAVYSEGSNIAISDTSNLSKMVQGFYPNTDTNFILDSNGSYFYTIARETDLIKKYDIKNPGVSHYGNEGYSLKDPQQDDVSRVHDIAFINDNKALLARYGKTKAWIIDPEANTSADFKTGEIDLGDYLADDDIKTPAPEMQAIALYDNKAFVALQRQGNTEHGYNYPRSAYIAVIDTINDTEIDTNPQSDGLKGIELQIVNPGKMIVSGNDLYVQGIDYKGGYSSGLVKINMDTYEQTLLYDANAESGRISDIAVINGQVFAIVYYGWKNNALAKVTENGELELIGNYKGQYLTLIDAGPEGNLWLGIGNSGKENPSRLVKLSKTDLSLLDSKDMDLDPIDLTFVVNN